MKKSEKLFLDYANERDLRESEKDILSFLIQKELDEDHVSIRKAAEELFVSTTSILRLCKKLGFSGYSEFIYNVSLKIHKMLDYESGSNTDIHKPLEEMRGEFLLNYSQTFQAIDEKRIESFLNELRYQNKIYFYGAGFSTFFSDYLSKKLELFGYYVSNASTSDSRAIFLNNIQKYRLLIVFSRSGETEKVIEKVQIAQGQGLKTVLFTGNRKSKTAQMADIVFGVLDPTIESQQEFQVTSYESNMIMLIDMILIMAVKKGIITEY